ncbi:MAG TPA: methyl-accepting chemotaxis protein [Patescibacteria group bacterium]|nr:methyl-accepting chemotaxis protein [Patescibacteria group bacterium]
MQSIQTKLTAGILGIFLLALGTLGGINYWKALGIITANVTRDMQEIAVNSAGDVGDWLETRKAELTVIAVSPEVQSGNREAIGAFVSNVVKANKIYSIIGFVYPDGSSVNSLGTNVNLKDREYFQKAIKGESFVSDPILPKSGGSLATAVAIPVKINGQVAGVLYGAVSLESLAQKVLSIKAGQTGYASLTQGDGLKVIHPDKEVAMKENPLTNSNTPADQKELGVRMAKGESGISRLAVRGVERYVAYAPVPGVNWSLAVAVPVVEVTGAVSSLTWVSCVTIVVVLLLTALVIVWYARQIAEPIKAIERVANQVADGNIRPVDLQLSSRDEIGRLGSSFEQMVQHLRGLIQKILSTTEQVAASSEELTASADQSALAAAQVADSITVVAEGAVHQMRFVENTTGIVERMAANLQEVADSANQVTGKSVQAFQKATDGGKSVAEAEAQMTQIQETVNFSAEVVSKLGERSKEIGQIVDTISGIAGQTNLLALNAAIEAARAGEQGRGFAVVAEEVRKLAEQSQESAKRIADLIGVIQSDTQQAVQAMNAGTDEVKVGTQVVNAAGLTFREIESLVSDVASQVKNISEAILQLAGNSREAVSSVKEIGALCRKSTAETDTVSAATEEQSASVQEIASASQSLAKMAQELQDAGQRFRL